VPVTQTLVTNLNVSHYETIEDKLAVKLDSGTLNPKW